MDYIIQGTHRAYMGADTVVAAWVRDDAGRRDLSGADAITATLYQGPAREVATFACSGNDQGRVSFNIDSEATDQLLAPGGYYLKVTADGEVIYTALVELV